MVSAVCAHNSVQRDSGVCPVSSLRAEVLCFRPVTTGDAGTHTHTHASACSSSVGGFRGDSVVMEMEMEAVRRVPV